MTQIVDLFSKDIFRPINGVIKAEQSDQDSRHQELDEYVITAELDKHFRSFYRHFNQSLDQRGDKNGIWISGFFGSGKSHFLKMLGYLLANKDSVGARKPLDFFEDKISDAIFWAELKRPTQVPMDVMLFNIDSKARSDSQKNKDSILNVFWRVFDDMRGYYGEASHIAEMEAHLDREGLLSSFQQSFARINGDSWHNKRRGHAFLNKHIVEALQEVTGLDEANAAAIIPSLKGSLNRTVEGFSKTVKEYLDSKGPKHRVLFLVDEVGQYIGGSPDLMLNLQTVVEDLGMHCAGRAWVIVTSQEDIDSILKHVTGDSKNDFSKIQGRFYAPLSLSSANTDEVIKKRLLTKKEDAQDALKAFYAREKVNLSNLITFSQDAAFYPRYRDAEDFVDTYPFMPYQFTLLQQVFRSIREAGSSGRHMAEGERSMLESFKLTLETLAKSELGQLVPFHYFYHAMEGFLEHSVRWVFQQAEKNETLEQPFDIQLLKVLFMIRGVKELKPNQDNLLTLIIDHIDADKASLRQSLQQGLSRLESQTLIQRNGDEYYFLTNEEQEIMRKIKSIGIDPSEVTQKLENLLWGKIFVSSKLRYDKQHSYDFNKMLDGVHSGLHKAALTLHLVSPCGDYPSYTETYCLTQTMAGNNALVRLPQDIKLYSEVQHILQTEKYFKLHGGSGGSTLTQQVKDKFIRDKDSREAELEKRLSRMISEADVFTNGEKIDSLDRKSPSALLEDALRRLVLNVYPKLDQISEIFESEKEVDFALQGEWHQKTNFAGEFPNAQARTSILNWFQEQQLRQSTVTVARLLEHFSDKPFGWAELDALGVTSSLIASSKLELRVHQERQSISSGLAKRLLSRQGRNEHTLMLQREVSADILHQARQILGEEFNVISPPLDPEEMFQAYREQLKNQAQELQAFLQKSRSGHPCHQQLLKTHKLITELCQPDHYQDFFVVFAAHQADLDDHRNTFADLESFYTGQVEIFEKNQATLQALSTEISHLEDPVLAQNYQRAQVIMAKQDDSIYKDLPNVSFLLGPVKDAVRDLLARKQKEVQSKIDGVIERLQNLYASMHEAGSLAELLKPLESLKKEVAGATQIDTVIARASRIDALETAVHQKVEDIRIIPPPPPPIVGKLPPIVMPPPPEKAVAVLHPKNFTNNKVLETQADVDQFIKNLRNKLEEHLNNNKRIQIQ